MQADDRRYINSPLCLLSETITAPGAGMNKLASKVIADYAQHCRPDAAGAVVQLAYAVRGKETLPQGLQRIAGRQSFVECVESLDECWGGSGDEFEATAKDVFGDPAEMFTKAELAEIVKWCSLRRSVAFLGTNVKVANYDGLMTTAAAVQKIVDGHASKFGAVCMATVPAKYFFETIDNAGDLDSMRLFRMVCAARSLIGKKRFTGTTKDMIRARMIGAKSPAVASVMASDSEPLQDELDAMGSRKRFDRLMDECAIRRFFCKVTLEGGRRMNLSTTIMEPDSLRALVENCMKKTRREAYRKGAPGGTSKGTPRGTPLTRHFQQGVFNKALVNKRHRSLAGSDVSLISPTSIHPDTEVMP